MMKPLPDVNEALNMLLQEEQQRACSSGNSNVNTNLVNMSTALLSKGGHSYKNNSYKIKPKG